MGVEAEASTVLGRERHDLFVYWKKKADAKPPPRLVTNVENGFESIFYFALYYMLFVSGSFLHAMAAILYLRWLRCYR